VLVSVNGATDRGRTKRVSSAFGIRTFGPLRPVAGGVECSPESDPYDIGPAKEKASLGLFSLAACLLHSLGFGVGFLRIVRLLPCLTSPLSFKVLGRFMRNVTSYCSSTAGTYQRPAAKTCRQDEGQSIIEYGVLLGIILILAFAALRAFEVNALAVLAQMAKSIT